MVCEKELEPGVDKEIKELSNSITILGKKIKGPQKRKQGGPTQGQRRREEKITAKREAIAEKYTRCEKDYRDEHDHLRVFPKTPRFHKDK